MKTKMTWENDRWLKEDIERFPQLKEVCDRLEKAESLFRESRIEPFLSLLSEVIRTEGDKIREAIDKDPNLPDEKKRTQFAYLNNATYGMENYFTDPNILVKNEKD